MERFRWEVEEGMEVCWSWELFVAGGKVVALAKGMAWLKSSPPCHHHDRSKSKAT